MTTHAGRTGWLGAWLQIWLSVAAIALLASVASGQGSVRPEGAPTRAIVIDGRFDDWPADRAAIADADYLYLRFSPGSDGAYAIQAAPEQVVLHLDLDGNAATGRALEGVEGASGLGIDLEIRFSPRVAGRNGTGVLLRAFGAQGGTTSISHADVDFMAAPTFASPWYEARLSRHVADVEPLAHLESALSRSGTFRGIVTVESASGSLVGVSEAFSGLMPARSATRAVWNGPLPPAPAGGLRVVSYNVEHAAPMTNPAPFANVLGSLAPDVVVVQEWTHTDESEIRGWFNAMLPVQGPWHVARNSTWGVAVVSRFPLENLTVQPVRTSQGRTVRFVAARMQTPMGPAVIGTVHLKCCGGAGTSEDVTRIAEATAVRDFIAAQVADEPGTLRFIAGDVNLVGTRTPLEVMAQGLDAGGADLAAAHALVFGDSAAFTWREARSTFAPGRLDWALYSPFHARLVRAFAVDTTRFGPRTLANAGLEAGDTDASDHLPLVVDLTPWE